MQQSFVGVTLGKLDHLKQISHDYLDNAGWDNIKIGIRISILMQFLLPP